jgi:hypothetical protein
MDFDQTWYILSPYESGTLLIFKVKGQGYRVKLDVDPRVFTRIVTDGSVTISPRNFVGEGIINCPLYIDNREIMFNNIGELIKVTGSNCYRITSL